MRSDEIFNLAARRIPALVVACHDAADVQRALREAAGRPVAVRAGGHSIGGHCLVQDGVVLDVRGLDSISVDLPNRCITIGAGCRVGDVLDALGSTHATPLAFDPRVGVAGLTLGGGYGMLSRLHGLACDNLLSVDLVLADGTRCTVGQGDALFWAMRGAGAHFAVATSLRFRIHPLRPLRVARVTYARSRLRELLDFYAALQLPDEATLYFGIGDQLELQGFSFGAAIALPGGALSDVVPYAAAHFANTDTFPERHHHRWRSCFFSGLTPAILDLLATAPLPGWSVLEHLGGAIGRVATNATAFPHRAATHGFVSALKWTSEPPAQALQQQQQLHDALRPHALGSYANYLDVMDAPAAYGANLPRLLALKAQVDPGCTFRGFT